MANKKKRRKLILGNTLENYTDKSFEYVIPNTEALKNWPKIRKFFKIPIMSKTEKKLMHCVLDQTFIRITEKYKRLNNIND